MDSIFYFRIATFCKKSVVQDQHFYRLKLVFRLAHEDFQKLQSQKDREQQPQRTAAVPHRHFRGQKTYLERQVLIHGFTFLLTKKCVLWRLANLFTRTSVLHLVLVIHTLAQPWALRGSAESL